MHDRLKILNIWVDPINKKTGLIKVLQFLQGERPHSIFASNPEKNFSVLKDPELYQVFKVADLLLPDGIGIVLAAKLLHGAKLSRVPGVEFMHAICKMAADEGVTVFIYGAKEAVNKAAADALVDLYPGFRLAGRANGYLKEEEMDGLVDTINRSKAQILFLALGSPRQEKWFATYKDRLTHVRVCQGIGGTLDTIAGTVKRAPEIWCRLNVEWLYRLLAEPKRIGRQKVLPIFAFQVVMKKIGNMFRKAPGSNPKTLEP